ncbi:hypothetical protein [Pantoea stewartii]|uniref:Uncharacterized protein n=1 Tax=Pantoea stewartii subsp. stewartii DC283 TaxID=660596 RepID=H3R9P9_PANSE|nr:hypothetical protein [Pantoea stewartii]ARF51359.1 hypothetical protein DSJ_19920 [Pantoea stewartii subsp. stewartii DC283]EHU01912.1 hypothetical protein CKS_0380 [Pantoea stewartii subsp. stewartii DC283]KAB0549299.1 hypothetical protein F7Q90_19935 [Pantoea stewartii subsp. stewartii]
MEKQVINCMHSRGLSGVNAGGLGRVVGRSQRNLPVVYAVPPAEGIAVPYIEVPYVLNGVPGVRRVSIVNGCRVMWG